MNKQKITIKNSSDECPTVTKFLLNYVEQNGISSSILDDLRLVIEETFINIVNYAHPQDVTRDISIELSHTSHSINITFTDTGDKFNPLADNIKEMNTEDLSEGGMGIHIIKSMTDEQQYKRVEQHNVFTVTKHYTKQN